MQARMKLIAVALAAALAAGGALAHSGFGHAGAHGRGMGMAGGPTPEAVAKRLGTLEDALKLQPHQMATWQAFEATIKTNAQKRAELREAMPPPADRDAMADFRVTMLKFAAQAAEQTNVARKALVATLSPEQKATFDSFRPGRGSMSGGGCVSRSTSGA